MVTRSELVSVVFVLTIFQANLSEIQSCINELQVQATAKSHVEAMNEQLLGHLEARLAELTARVAQLENILMEQYMMGREGCTYV